MAMTFAKKEEGVYSLDVTGYVCPHPQIYTKKALEKIHGGDVLEVENEEREGDRAGPRVRRRQLLDGGGERPEPGRGAGGGRARQEAQLDESRPDGAGTRRARAR